MSDEPDLSRIAADEDRVGALLRAVEVPAPPALRREIIARNATRRRRSRLRPALALTVATACAAIVLALTLSPGTSAPSVVRASALALAPPSGSAPASLVATGTSIRFPDWTAIGWPATGARHDRLGGRALTTEFFTGYRGRTAGYTIASGAPLRWGAATTPMMVGGERYEVIAAGGATIVAWVQAGHTCIIASRSVSVSSMLALASRERSAAA